MTESIRRHPYSVVQLDEVEKAHPHVFNVLLHVLDDGRLTDSKGRVVDFKNTVMIMTSNIGSHRIMDAGGDRDKAIKAVNEELMKAYRPEFLNRIDEKIVFDPLTRDDMDHIFDIQLQRVRNLLAARELGLAVTPEARTAICDAGFDPAYGARPLKRAITTLLMNPMSGAIVGGGYEAGDSIRVTLEDDSLAFECIPGERDDDDSPLPPRQLETRPTT